MAGLPINRDVTDLIYEAAVMPDMWPVVLSNLMEISGAAWTTVIAVHGADSRWVTSSTEADEIVTAHFVQFSGNTRTKRLLAKPHAGFITDYDILTQDEIDSEPVYQDFLIPRGYGYGVGTVILPPTENMIVVHCENRISSGPFGNETVQRLDGLRPHLARAALLSARLAFERARTAVDTLSALGLSACAVRQSGAVVVANAQFDGDAALWTTRGGDRIALADRRADRQLRDALAALDMEHGVRSLALAGSETTPPAVLHVVPIRRSAHDLFVNAAAILVLTKASAEPTGATTLLQALFDLSPTEATIAARVAGGQTVEQIAQADAKSVDTVRNQLKSVLAKTGCRRQVDLARLLAQLVPGGI